MRGTILPSIENVWYLGHAACKGLEATFAGASATKSLTQRLIAVNLMIPSASHLQGAWRRLHRRLGNKRLAEGDMTQMLLRRLCCEGLGVTPWNLKSEMHVESED